MDKSVDTFEPNKGFLSASFRKFQKKSFFVDSQPPLSPFSMFEYAPWTLSPGYNIEKGRGGRNVKIGDWKTHAFNAETGLFRGLSQLLLSMTVAPGMDKTKKTLYCNCPPVRSIWCSKGLTQGWPLCPARKIAVFMPDTWSLFGQDGWILASSFF